MIACAGVELVMLPPWSPNLNACTKRSVCSVKESCADRMIFFGEESLRTAVQNFITHHYSERNHQALANKLSSAEPGDLGNTGPPSSLGSAQSVNGQGKSDTSNIRTICGHRLRLVAAGLAPNLRPRTCCRSCRAVQMASQRRMALLNEPHHPAAHRNDTAIA